MLLNDDTIILTSKLAVHAAREPYTPLATRLAFSIRDEINVRAWTWFQQHANDTVAKVGFWKLSVTIKVRDLRKLFEQLFGEEV